jgi:signal transduction histidine kinase
MISIRLSLTLCFLLLLTVALVTDSLFVFQTAEETLEGKQRSAAELIETQYEASCENERRRLDDLLLLQARTLARLVSLQPDQLQVASRRAHRLAILSTSQAPCGYLLAPSWVVVSTRSTLFFDLYRLTIPLEIRLSDSKLTDGSLNGGQPADYFQISSPHAVSYASASMKGRSFRLDMSTFGADHLVHWEFNELPLPDGIKAPSVRVRRVILKATAPPRPLLPEEDTGPIRVRLEDGKEYLFGAGAAIFIQYAMETRMRDEAIASFQAKRAEEIDALAERTRKELTSLRDRLVATGLVIFVATALGSLLLVRLGLAPLRRLGDAVSRISTRDFRLFFHEGSLASELRPIVERLTHTLAQLERAFAREKQATADISHELRTPLAALMTNIDFALRRPRSIEDYQEVLNDCRQSVQHMNQAIERLLILARLDAGVEVLRMQPVDVGILAEQCAAVVRPLAAARGLELVVRRKGQTLIQSDPAKVREILNNLLHNAIEYNKPQGRIELMVSGEDGQLDLLVRDTGIGIPPEARDHIFERFYRADFARGGDGLHTGLGLPIVKQYVELLGGRISVDSKEGEGSTFHVELPARS